MHSVFSRLCNIRILRYATVILLVLAVLVGSFAIWGRIAICRAAQSDNLVMVKLLLKIRPDLVFSRYKEASFSEPDESGWTPLHYAVAYGHKDIAELLLANKADVNAKGDGGETPLYEAAYENHTDVADVLLANGADVNIGDRGGWTPLYAAVATEHYDMVKWLLAHKADVNAVSKDGQTSLSVAAECPPLNVVVVKLLLANGADVNIKGFDGWTALHVAVVANNKDMVEMLLTNKANVNAVDNDGRTPLHMAVRRGYQNIVELLRQYGGQDTTPANIAILDAAEDGDLKTAEALLKKNPALVFTKNPDGSTPLLLAAHNGHKDVAQLLLTNKADVNVRDNWGDTPLHWAIMSLSPRDLVELLLANGADVNARDKEGKSPLHLAVLYWWQDPTIAELLLAKGADVNPRNNQGQTPFYIAARDGEKDVAELLRQHGGHE